MFIRGRQNDHDEQFQLEMSSPSLVKLGPRTPENRSVKVPMHRLKLHSENVLNRQRLSRGLHDFAQILYRA